MPPLLGPEGFRYLDDCRSIWMQVFWTPLWGTRSFWRQGNHPAILWTDPWTVQRL